MTIKNYEKQATDFLDKFRIRFRATLSDSKTCPWCDAKTAMAQRKRKGAEVAPHHYRVTLSKPLCKITKPGHKEGN